MTKTTNKKTTIIVLLGGQSSEHEISLLSARNIIRAMSPEKYKVIPIGIDRTGKWWLQSTENLLENESNPKKVKLVESKSQISLKPGEGPNCFFVNDKSIGQVDCVFPVLHGPKGEDGSIQGLLKLLGLRFVGCDVLASAACMDKDITKRLLSLAEIPNSKYLVTEKDGEDLHFNVAQKSLGTPMFIKPANQGSSVGVYKVNSEEEFETGLKQAFKFDTKLLVEEAVSGREIECSVLGNSRPVASLPGEIILSDVFYSFETKYISDSGAQLQIPAKLSEAEVAEVQSLAIKAYTTLGCSGLARVDFFLNESGKFIVNEINTMPGFTRISMYPSMWAESGIDYPELIDNLVDLAMARWESITALKSSVQ